MMDRLLICTLQLTIVGMICACAIGSMIAGYHGLLQLIGGQVAGGGWVAFAVILGVVTYQLSRNRNDLVDR